MLSDTGLYMLEIQQKRTRGDQQNAAKILEL